jgi:hypothetical protein
VEKTTLYLFFLPHHPCCLLLKLIFHINISGFLQTTALIESKVTLGNAFIKIGVWMLLSEHA